MILIIDDDEMILNSIKKQLKGYNLFTSKNPEESLLLLKAGELTPDLILCDIMMPEMDGFEFVEKVRKIERFRHIPIIFITGICEDSYRIKGLELGAIDYLTKPFRKEEILLKVRNILEYQEQFRKHLTKESNDKSANENKNISIVKNLTRRELEIATLAASYYSSKEISIFTNIPKKIKPRHKTEPI